MKLERSKIKGGSGSGKDIYESNLFRVVVWYMDNGLRTRLTIKYSEIEIHFDGEHNISSDYMCFEQLTTAEVIRLIETISERSFELGRESKVNEFKKLFDL